MGLKSVLGARYMEINKRQEDEDKKNLEATLHIRSGLERISIPTVP